jgi:membrane peptidoglycan carboxypeptidase
VRSPERVRLNEAVPPKTWLLGFIPYIDPVNWMRKHDHSLLSNAASLIVCGLLAGLVVAAAAFPAIAVTALAAKAGADDFDNLPSTLRQQLAPQASNIYASDGHTLIATIYDENRHDVSIDEISPNMLNAIVASEDTRFYTHHGVDPRGILRAFVNNNSSGGDNQQGASTLTMQYVRLQTSYTATSPQEVLDATQDTVGRKVREMHEAIAVEDQLTQQFHGDQHAAKQEILRRYLNIAPFGEQTFGIYAAAETYFSETPGQLTVAQSALLAGLVQAPSTLDPTIYPKAAVERRNKHVLPNMLSAGYITKPDYDAAVATPLKLKFHVPRNGCTASVNIKWGFFCDYVQRWWDTQQAFGSDAFTRENQLETGGYTIVTSLNVGYQAAADKALTMHTSNHDIDTMMLAGVQPGTGKVQVMAVNRTFSNNTEHNGEMQDPNKRQLGEKGNYPNTTLPLISGDPSISGYQFGSTFKMFTMIAALQDGLPLSYNITAQKQYFSNYPARDDPNACAGYYCPKSAETGTYNMWTAFGHSVNGYFVPLEDRMSTNGDASSGPAKAVSVASKLGLTFPEYNGKPTFDSFTLGVTPTFPLEMAAAYAGVAAEGKYCAPTPIQSITDFEGNALDVGKPQCTQAIDSQIADAALSAAKCPVGNYSGQGCTGGTASNTQGFSGGNMHGYSGWAGKTGTTDGGVADAFIGMTPYLAIAGEYADTDYGLDPHSIEFKHSWINQAVTNTMAAVVKGKKKLDWPDPPSQYTSGQRASVPGLSGCQSRSSVISMLTGHGFRYIVQHATIDSTCPAGTVAAIDPSGSSSKGAVIAIYMSSGNTPPPPAGTPPSGGPPSGGPGGKGGGKGPGGGGGTPPTFPPGL